MKGIYGDCYFVHIWVTPTSTQDLLLALPSGINPGRPGGPNIMLEINLDAAQVSSPYCTVALVPEDDFEKFLSLIKPYINHIVQIDYCSEWKVRSVR